jgi:hypothetical protein
MQRQLVLCSVWALAALACESTEAETAPTVSDARVRDAAPTGGTGGAAPDATGSGGQVADALPLPPDAEVRPSLCLESPGGEAAFIEDSDSLGIGRAGLDVEGIRIAAMDLDGDGWDDLVVHSGRERTADPTDPMPYALLMNRAAASGPENARTFVDETRARGYNFDEFEIEGRVAHFALAGDVDNDGDLDLLSAVSGDTANDTGARTVLLLNDGRGYAPAPRSALSTDATQATTSATFLDFDRDGFLDVFIGNGYLQFGNLGTTQQDRLYRGRGDGTFDDVTETAGLETKSPLSNGGLDLEALNRGECHKPTYGVAACDLDGDGDGDLLSVSYGRQMNMLFVNEDGRFADQSVPSGFAADENLDFGDNEFYRCHCALSGNCQAAPARIQCDRDNWNAGLDDQPFRLGGNTFAVACADVNDDGRADVLTGAIKHWHIGDSSDTSTLLTSGGEADAVRLERGDNEALGLARRWRTPSWNEGDIFSAIFDYDLDGRKDLYWGSTDYPETRSFLYRQLDDGTFEEVAPDVGLEHARAAGFGLADVDRDGDLDVFMGSSQARCSANDAPPCPWTTSGPDVFFFRNTASDHHNWIAVDLDGLPGAGTPANRAGIGAKITVRAGGKDQHYEVIGGHGHFGQQDTLTAHVGLGTTCEVESVTVRWPDAAKTTTTHVGVRANTFVRLSRDGATVETYAPERRP